MGYDNLIQNKSYQFALSIVELWKALKAENHHLITNQLLRSGTSIGANVEEALGCITNKDFTYKMSLAYKEARESSYWLRLFRDSEIISRQIAGQLLHESRQLERLLLSIIKSTKRNTKNS